ncbi:bacterial low temperature requirement A protein-domain-containing protein [Zychaea mexicana]|uniref:bacterial low temperature requirement A protein-domain-containing protein n=1 Tax=Zychaea mexicana TaxID=64656 RepID=UPI0022FE6D31|nr:bacterial low temperature requirement A protein-domain-containing protein [Zychaea mexicana]KAI9484498.1 bacterial low temperature requirement A protein-domain-containing protein [Zychaea mexicana]
MASQAFGRGLTIGRQQQHNHHHHHVRHRSNGSRPSLRQDGIELEQQAGQQQQDGEEFVEVRHHNLSRPPSRQSSVTHHSSSLHRRPVSSSGYQPHRRHGHETFGDVMLHPIKEYELHRQRVHEYQEDKKVWEQQHDPEKASDTPIVPGAALEAPRPFIRTMIHLRHLMGGDQQIRITKAMVDHLKEPLELTDDEILKLYQVHDTDELIEFFHKSGRDYSLKIHKTVNRKKKLSGEGDDDTSSSSSSSSSEDEQDRDETQNSNKNNEKKTKKSPIDSPGSADNKEAAPLTQPKPVATMNGDDMIIELNDNVFIEVKRYWPSEDELDAEGPSRRPIFLLPDPDLSDEIGEETSATWLELFGDVFYVGFLATFTHEHHIVDQQQLGLYASWFVVVWWTWCAGALYSSRYETGDVMHHIYKIIELCGLVGMAGSSANFWDNPFGFIVGYMVMKAVLLIEYSVVLWAATMSGSFAKRPLAGYVIVHAIALVLWGVSLLYTDNRGARFALWYISIFLEVVVHIYLKSHKQVSLAASHLGERFALFTLVVLGENCMGFIRAVMESGTEVRVVVANMFGLVIIFLFFFMYFDDFSKEVLSGQVKMSQLWMYLHFPLHLCQVAFGIALTDAITIYAEGGAGSLESATATAAHMVSTWTNKMAVVAAAAADEGGEASSHVDPSYVYKSFWVSGGLILVLNAIIKLINTPVSGARWSGIICTVRVLNGVVFFALTATTYDDLDGLAMLGIMVACLLFQGAIDLLD